MKELEKVRIVVTDKNKTLDLETYKKYLDKCVGIKEVILYGDKDVFSNKDIFDIIAYSYSKNVKVTAYTSFLFSKETLDIFNEDISFVIKIYSNDPELYLKFHKVKIDKLIDNLTYASKYKPHIKLIFQPYFTKETLPTIDKIIPLAKKCYADLSPYIPRFVTHKEELELSPFELENSDKLIQHFIDISRYFGIKTEFKCYYPSPRYCEDAYEIPTVGLNGDIFLCSYMHDSIIECWCNETTVLPRNNYIIGNLNTLASIQNVWNNYRYKLLRKKHNEIRNFEKIHPYDKGQYLVIKKEKDVDGFNYCNHCLWRLNQCM